MKIEVGSYDAKTRLPELLRQVRTGKSFTITHRGQAIADLIPSPGAKVKDRVAAAERLKAFMLADPVRGVNIRQTHPGRTRVSFVLDNSMTMRWFFGDGKPQELAYASRVLERMKKDSAVVPATWALEVANVIAQAESKSLVTEARSGAFLEMLAGMDIDEDPTTFAHALSGTLQLARRYKLSAYDASYLELALRLGLSLATLDTDLYKAAKKAGVNRLA